LSPVNCARSSAEAIGALVWGSVALKAISF
jgi:hypothetical protein